MKKIFGILIIFLTLYLTGCEKEKEEEKEVITELGFTEKCAYEEGNPWLYYFCISYTKDENGNFTIPSYYDFNGVDMAKKLNNDDFCMETFDVNTGEKLYEMKVEQQILLYYRPADEDVEKIHDYFEEKRFERSITLEDLKDLELSYVNKDIIVDLFNKALDSTEPTLGKYLTIPFQSSYDKRVNNGVLKVGYILDYGHIKFLKIDFLYDEINIHLSDLIANNQATSEQQSDYEHILELSDLIISNQSFKETLDYQGKTFDFNEIYSLLNQIEE